MLDGNIVALVSIVFLVLALNFYFMIVRMRRGTKKQKGMSRVAMDEAKQALWREKEIARRLAREQEDAEERVKLRNETLALYEEVRNRYASEDSREKYMQLRKELLCNSEDKETADSVSE